MLLLLLLLHSSESSINHSDQCSLLHWIVEASWNVMAHAQKADFVFRRNGRFHLNLRGTSVQSTTGNRGGRISGSNAGYTIFGGSVKSTVYPLHSPVSPPLPLPCVTVCRHISTWVHDLIGLSDLCRRWASCKTSQKFVTSFMEGMISEHNLQRTTKIAQRGTGLFVWEFLSIFFWNHYN